jgi:hypothetical protein
MWDMIILRERLEIHTVPSLLAQLCVLSPQKIKQNKVK